MCRRCIEWVPPAAKLNGATIGTARCPRPWQVSYQPEGGTMPDPADTFLLGIIVGLQRQRADLVLSGDVDIAAIRRLADAVHQLSVVAPGTVVIDLAAVTFAGAVLVNFLARLHRGIPVTSVICVCRPTAMATAVLRVTNMAQITTVLDHVPA